MAKLIIDLVLIIFSSWTLGYHLTFVSRIPYFWAGILAIVFLAGLLYIYFFVFKDERSKFVRPGKKELPILLAIAGMAVLLGLFCAATIGTDPDNIGYFYNPLIQSYNLRSPIFDLHQAIIYDSPLPALSTPHVFISLEQLVALTGRLTGISPGIVYHTILPFFVGMFTVVCLYYVFSVLSLKDWDLVLAIGVVLLFLFISGYSQQYGIWLLLLNYRGKALLPITFIPVYLVSLYNYLNHPRKKEFFLLFLFGIIFIGFSTSGPVYLLIMMFSVSVGYLIIEGVSKKTTRRVMLTGLSGMYVIVYSLLLMFEILPIGVTPLYQESTETWREAITSRFFSNDALVIGYVLLLIAVPLLSMKKKWAIIIPLYSTMIFLLFANNIFSPLMVKFFTSHNQWRMYYLLPVPIMAGMIPSLIKNGLKRMRDSRQPAQLLVGLLAVILISYGSDSHLEVKWKDNLFDFKVEREYQTFLDEYPIGDFSRSVVMPSDNISTALTLVDPSIRYYSDRALYSLLFSRAYDFPDLRTRTFFQLGLNRCDIERITRLPGTIEYFVRAKVDYIIYENCEEAFTMELLELLETHGGIYTPTQYISSDPEYPFVVWILER